MKHTSTATPGTQPRLRHGWGRGILLCLAGTLIPFVPLGDASTPDSAAAAVAAPQTARLLDQLGVHAWHAAGYRGRGLTVAILDTGFCGYREHLGKALPASVRVHSFRRDGNLEARDSRHGILCAEVVHTLAPDAELLLANWETEQPEQFLDAVRWARGQGARVMTCSLIMPTWSDGAGHGPVHEELTRLVGRGDRPGDVLFFASAGNIAQRHWGGAFRDAGDGWHVWAPGETGPVIDNPIHPWGGERVSVELYWSSGSYELVVRDTTTDREIGRAQTQVLSPREGVPHAVVAFMPQERHAYSARVSRLDNGSGPFHLAVLGGGLRCSRRRGSIPFPGDGHEVMAVGAVDASGRRCDYSACGPTLEQVKPDLVAQVPFPSSWRPLPFSGTSAASPQAAALAALVWSRHADWNAQAVRDTLRLAARPSPAALKWEMGQGLIHLP
jgi:hypothetical protein